MSPLILARLVTRSRRSRKRTNGTLSNILSRLKLHERKQIIEGRKGLPNGSHRYRVANGVSQTGCHKNARRYNWRVDRIVIYSDSLSFSLFLSLSFSRRFIPLVPIALSHSLNRSLNYFLTKLNCTEIYASGRGEVPDVFSSIIISATR